MNYINPFGPITYFGFNVINTSDVSLLIYNSNGDLLYSVTEEKLSAGKYRMYFTDEIKDFPSGTYSYQIKMDGKNSEMKKFILMK